MAPHGKGSTSTRRKVPSSSGSRAKEKEKKQETSVVNAPTTITIKLRSPVTSGSSSSPAEFGSVWFRNHNPNHGSTPTEPQQERASTSFPETSDTLPRSSVSGSSGGFSTTVITHSANLTPRKGDGVPNHSYSTASASSSPSHANSMVGGTTRRGYGFASHNISHGQVNSGSNQALPPPPPPPPPPSLGATLESIPSWARYRLPPPSSPQVAGCGLSRRAATTSDCCGFSTPMNSNAEPFVIGASSPTGIVEEDVGATQAHKASPPPATSSSGHCVTHVNCENSFVQSSESTNAHTSFSVTPNGGAVLPSYGSVTSLSPGSGLGALLSSPPSPSRPHPLYPYTIDGLSTEMYDYVLAMRLTSSERAAREALREKIEKVVNNLWPASQYESVPSSSTSPSAACPNGAEEAPMHLRKVPSFSTPHLTSLVSSARSSLIATPNPDTGLGESGAKDNLHSVGDTLLAENTVSKESVSLGGEGAASNGICLSEPLTKEGFNEGNCAAKDAAKLSASVILFGSYALDLATPHSDLDFSIVFSGASSALSMASPSSSSLPVPIMSGQPRSDVAADGKSKMTTSVTVSADADSHDAHHHHLADDEAHFKRFALTGGRVGPSFEILRLRELAEALQTSDSSIEVKVLEECRVPVAHVVHIATGVSADISINMPHMTDVVAMQKEWLAEEEGLEEEEGTNPDETGVCVQHVSKVRALIVLTKLALRQWGVGCSFTGGLSSTGVYLLVERYLREGRAAGCLTSPLPPLGRLVIDFWTYLSSDIFQNGFLAADIFHHSNKRRRSALCGLNGGEGLGMANAVSSAATASVLSSPREPCILDANSPEFVPTPKNLSPVGAEGPGGFPTGLPSAYANPLSVSNVGTSAQGVSRSSSINTIQLNMANLNAALATSTLPDVTRRCTRMTEIQFLFRHSASTLEQIIAPGARGLWSLPTTALSAVLADPRQCPAPSTVAGAGGFLTRRSGPHRVMQANSTIALSPSGGSCRGAHSAGTITNANSVTLHPPAGVRQSLLTAVSNKAAAPSTNREGSHDREGSMAPAQTSHVGSERSSTPGASSNGSDLGVSPSTKGPASGSPVKFTSSLKNFVGAPCFVPKKLSGAPPPEYQLPTNGAIY